MQDAEFEALKIRAAIAPSAESWPSGEGQPSIAGDVLTTGGELHWTNLHAAVNDARTRVTQALQKMDAADADTSLSKEGKATKKAAIAEAALEGLKKSTSLAKARETVERQVKKWEEASGLAIKPPSSPEEIALQSEIRAHISGMKGNKLNFISQHADDPRVVAAVLGGPSFLCGLSSSDIDTVKTVVAKRVAPDVVELKAATIDALRDAERGWRNAITQISTRGGIKGTNGPV